MGEMGFTDETARLAHTEALLSDRPLALVVLGMHRSGTSALTRVLSLSGLTLPQDLMTPAEDNPDGFWESDRISHFNNRLLEAKGTYWDDPFSFSAEPRGQALLRPYVNEGVDLLREDFPGNLPIVFKDPRLSLLAPFWHEVLDRAGYTPRYVISMRHPAEIARSLAKRDGFALQKSYLMWFNYMLSIERDTRMLQRCFVAYDDLLSDWPLTLDTIEKKLHIRFDRRDPAAQNAIQAALKTDLRHHNSNAFNRSSHTIPAWIQYINTQMSAPGFEAFDDADPKLKQLVTRYTQQRVFYGPILSDMESRISHQQAITKELEAKMLQSSAAYEAELASRIDELQQERTKIETLLTQKEEQETALAHLRVEISDRNQALERKSDALSQSLSQISQMQLSTDEMQAGYEAQNAEYEKTLHEKQAGYEAQIAHYENTLHEMQAGYEAQNAEYEKTLHEKQAGYEAQIAHYENTLHEMQAGYEAQNAEYEKTLHEKQAERTHALSVIESLQVELKREQTVSLDRHRNLVSVSTELNAIRSSKSWRITRIPRAFGARLPNLLKRPQARIEPPYNTGFTVPVTQQAAPPIKSSPTDDKFTNAHTAAYAEPDQSVQTQLEDATAQSWKGFDPSPVAEFLRQRDGREAGAQAFIKQCRTFALPYETDQTDKPELCLSDQQARDWIHQVKTLSQDPFHKFGQADISIILPVYNQLPFTLSALASVYTQKTSHHFEIILADDASTDQTQELGQAGIQNLHISRTEGNLGFLGNVNQAAKKAQGKYIVLLNNDTIALDGWLDALIDTLESDPGIGLVGSQLIFPSGRLQEAGGIVWRDGSAWNYGRNEDPQDPRYAFARDVDYCSGASIALPRALWEALGGFDGETYLKA